MSSILPQEIIDGKRYYGLFTIFREHKICQPLYFHSVPVEFSGRGNGPKGSPDRSVVELCPAALPEKGVLSVRHWSYMNCGTLLRSCMTSGASINSTARPASRCHSMWPKQESHIRNQHRFRIERWKLTMHKPNTRVIGYETQCRWRSGFDKNGITTHGIGLPFDYRWIQFRVVRAIIITAPNDHKCMTVQMTIWEKIIIIIEIK